MTEFSPAKINLGLRIPYKRSTDGYHQIESIFLRIDWGDELEIQELADSNEDFHLKITHNLKGIAKEMMDSVGETGEWKENLLYKTWIEAKKINPSIPGLNIHLFKKIPPGGGLGGGSSNSGTLWKHFIKQGFVDKISAFHIAKRLGADIPFFLLDSHAWVTGIGDELEPISIASGYGLLVIPPVSLSTKTMYLNLKKTLQKPLPSKTWKEQEEIVLLALEEGNWRALQGILRNDFEEFAFQDHSLLLEIRDEFLRFGADYSAMSGSGSTMYGLMDSISKRQQVHALFQQKYPELDLFPFSF